MRRAALLVLQQSLALLPLGLTLLWLPWARILQELLRLPWCDLLLLLAAAGTVLCSIGSIAGEALGGGGGGTPGAGVRAPPRAYACERTACERTACAEASEGGGGGGDRAAPLPAAALPAHQAHQLDAAGGAHRSAHVKIMDMWSSAISVSNPASPAPFETDLARGHYVLLHRPSEPPPEMPPRSDSASSSFDPHAYFEGKKRLWEVRITCTFKKAVRASTLRCATSPFKRPSVGPGQVQMHRWLFKMAGPAMRGLYQSPGDDPKGRAEHDIEQPVTSVPICEADQYIQEAPASLLDGNFPNLGRIKARDPDFRRTLSETTFQVGETHTFAFWGISRAINLIGWQIASIPMFQGVSLDTVNGPPPLYFLIYHLSPGDGQETRHLPYRMEILFKAAGWSSSHPPSQECMGTLQELATGSLSEEELRKSDSHASGQTGKGAPGSRAYRHRPSCCGPILPAGGCKLRQLVWG